MFFNPQFALWAAPAVFRKPIGIENKNAIFEISAQEGLFG